MYTLRKWQQLRKDKNDIIINASDTSGTDTLNAFPIGMYYRYLDYENLETQVGNHDNLVFCGIRDYTDIYRKKQVSRSKIIKTLASKRIENTILTSADYFKSLPSYKFVVSPEGNGIDCHRHYEALMAGCIPIVEDTPYIRSLYENCPILYTSDYSEITPEYLVGKYNEMIDKEYNFSRLFISSYSPELQKQIKINGNHWTNVKLKKIKWDIK